MWKGSAATRCVVSICLGAAVLAEAADLCVLSLAISSRDSQWAAAGNLTKPIDATITRSKLSATGFVYLRVPADSSAGSKCPPANLSASQIVSVFGRSSFVLPTQRQKPAISFTTDIKSNVTTKPNDPTAKAMAVLNLDGLEIGLSGNQPLGPMSVTVATGSAAEARTAAQQLCSQLLLLHGTLNLTSALGPRTADLTNVAYNRSMAAGVSAQKNANSATTAVLTIYIANASVFLDVSPKSMPGIESTSGTYLLAGDVVASAHLEDPKNWFMIPAAETNWALVPRLDAPVVLGGHTTPRPRYIGVNSTMMQQCQGLPFEPHSMAGLSYSSADQSTVADGIAEIAVLLVSIIIPALIGGLTILAAVHAGWPRFVAYIGAKQKLPHKAQASQTQTALNEV